MNRPCCFNPISHWLGWTLTLCASNHQTPASPNLPLISLPSLLLFAGCSRGSHPPALVFVSALPSEERQIYHTNRQIIVSMRSANLSIWHSKSRWIVIRSNLPLSQVQLPLGPPLRQSQGNNNPLQYWVHHKSLINFINTWQGYELRINIYHSHWFIVPQTWWSSGIVAGCTWNPQVAMVSVCD